MELTWILFQHYFSFKSSTAKEEETFCLVGTHWLLKTSLKSLQFYLFLSKTKLHIVLLKLHNVGYLICGVSPNTWSAVWILAASSTRSNWFFFPDWYGSTSSNPFGFGFRSTRLTFAYGSSNWQATTVFGLSSILSVCLF